MKIKKPGLALMVAFVSVFGLSQTASAAPCGAQVDALKAALNNGYCSYGKKNHCKGLNHKLDNVYRKLEKGKFDNAGRKLANFYDVVENLATRKKNPQMALSDFRSLADPHYVAAEYCITRHGVVEEPEVVEPNPGWDLDNE